MNAREWKPGEVGVDERWGYRGIYVAECHQHGRTRGVGCWHNESGLSDRGDDPRRPLVVIDPEDREQVERLAAEVANALYDWPEPRAIGPDAMQAALREFATPKPPACTAVLTLATARIPCEGDAGHDLPHRNASVEAEWGGQ